MNLVLLMDSCWTRSQKLYDFVDFEDDFILATAVKQWGIGWHWGTCKTKWKKTRTSISTLHDVKQVVPLPNANPFTSARWSLCESPFCHPGSGRNPFRLNAAPLIKCHDFLPVIFAAKMIQRCSKYDSGWLDKELVLQNWIPKPFANIGRNCARSLGGSNLRIFPGMFGSFPIRVDAQRPRSFKNVNDKQMLLQPTTTTTTGGGLFQSGAVHALRLHLHFPS